MNAGSRIVYHAPHDIRVEPQPARPEPGAGEVRVRVEACAICGTDVKTYRHGNPRLQPPRTMGHEFCGTIDALGAGVTRYQPGQRVTMATTMGCGDCFYCRQRRTNICPHLTAMGFHHDGAMATAVIIPPRGVAQGYLVEVGSLDAELACLSEPVSCVMNNLSQLPGHGVRTMLIIGLGPLGVLHALAARARGVEVIVGVVRNPRPSPFTLTDTVTPDAIPVAIRKWTDGLGFDAVMVTAPDAAMQGAAPAFARKGGYVSLFASLPVGTELIQLNSRTVHYGEQTIYGTSDSTVAHVEQAVAFLRANREAVRPIITHRLALEQFETGIQSILDRTALKVVLLP